MSCGSSVIQLSFVLVWKNSVNDMLVIITFSNGEDYISITAHMCMFMFKITKKVKDTLGPNNLIMETWKFEVAHTLVQEYEFIPVIN